MVSSIRLENDVPAEMRDGAVLRADIYRPGDMQRHPAILIRTPYNKALMLGISGMLNIMSLVKAGYAVAIQDVRGRYASGGQWKRQDMFAVEGLDGYDSIEWLASQRWCDGNVGMAGISYLAGLQWFTAMGSPPHLKAIAPWMGGMRSLGIGMAPVLTGGAIALIAAVSRVGLNAPDVVDRLEREGQDVAEIRRALEWAERNPDEAYNFLPLKDLPILRFEQIREIWNANVHPVPEDELEKSRKYEKVMVPCHQLCGWYDVLEFGTFESFAKMKVRGGSQLAREGQYVIAGPWAHGQPTTTLGEINFGTLAGAPQPSISEQQIAFYDKYLRGKDIKIPTVRYFVMGRNKWQEADSWPLPQTQWQRFYMHSRGSSNTAVGDGLLSRDEPESEPPDRFIYDPHRPVPTHGGRIGARGCVPAPLDQSRIEMRNDILCYTTPELKEDVEVTGPLEIHVFAATSARDTDFAAKVVDVYPDGRALNLAEGIKRAKGRLSESRPELVNPGEVYEYVIVMGDTSQLFRKGHRIRIDISSSNFPAVDRNMNTGNPIGEDARGIPAMQTIYHQTGYASYIDLPVIPEN